MTNEEVLLVQESLLLHYRLSGKPYWIYNNERPNHIEWIIAVPREKATGRISISQLRLIVWGITRLASSMFLHLVLEGNYIHEYRLPTE